ncbi:branched-chain amino acid ABC transporter permease [Gephyromycinifex aptenodytis]|uniref:branched-chain amino acid ABC transporter permease n=1 Tax=Gephyromycinifex aptenodytis TaxID=2716227 RepID=UPI001446D4E3|nr:branched-chain amino acid ABC transporter permease [Gephyromycinifex aptenodytis]
MTNFLALSANGLANGSIYGLLALSLVTVFRSTGYLNFAQGEMAMLSTFLVFTGVSMGLHIWIAVAVAVVLSAAVAAGIQFAIMGPLERKGHDVALIALLGLFLFINAFNGAVWGLGSRAPLALFPSGLNDGIQVLDGDPPLVLSYAVIGTWITVILLLSALWLLLNRTRLGLAYRAVVSNRDSAGLVGIPVSGMFALGWALAAVPALFAGVITSQLTGTLSFTMMVNVLVFGFTAACLGGFDSPVGAVVGGLIVGLVEALFPFFVPAVGNDSGLVIAIVLLLAVLMIRPNGLFGRMAVTRV